MAERWKDIPGYEGRYQVSDQGRVRSLAFYQRYLHRNGKEGFRLTKQRILSQRKQNAGYLIAQLWLNDRAKGFTVHRLVAQAFVKGTGETVNHKDGVKTNNRASNLEWCSYSDNHRHALAMGLNKRAKRVIRSDGTVFLSIAQAAKISRVAHRNIRACIRGQRALAGGFGWTAA